MAKRKCKTCGNLFEPKGPNDRYCSDLCKRAGCYLRGGGDTSKPGVEEAKPSVNVRPRNVRTGKKEYPRVLAMLELPPVRRWEIAKDFNEEERAYAKRLARKALMDDGIAARLSDWNNGDEDEEEIVMSEADRLGESDDGSV